MLREGSGNNLLICPRKPPLMGRGHKSSEETEDKSLGQLKQALGVALVAMNAGPLETTRRPSVLGKHPPAPTLAGPQQQKPLHGRSLPILPVSQPSVHPSETGALTEPAARCPSLTLHMLSSNPHELRTLELPTIFSDDSP